MCKTSLILYVFGMLPNLIKSSYGDTEYIGLYLKIYKTTID